MYLRTVRAKGAEGVEFEYIRLVEAYWENGRSKQRIIANLGRKDLLAPNLESLIELLSGGKKTKSSSVCAGPIEATHAACWGPMLVARSLWRELGALEGKYVIQTEEVDLSAVQAVEGYKDLSEVERSFRELKDLIE